MFIPNTVHGPVGKVAPDNHSPATAPAPRTAGISDDLGPVLASIPDLDAKAAPAISVKTPDGRIIGQALSLKMIFGLAVGLILGAVLPFMFGRSGSPKPVQELPAFNTQAAEPAGENQRIEAPKWQPAAQVPAVAAQAATMNMTPPPAGSYRPNALAPPSWSPPRSSAAPPQPANNLSQDYARGNLPPARPDDGRYGYVPPTERRDFGAPAERVVDRRNDPGAPYGNPPATDYRGNSVDPAAVRGGPANGPAYGGPGYGGPGYGGPGYGGPGYGGPGYGGPGNGGPAYRAPSDDRYRPAPDAAGPQYNMPPPPPGYGAGGDYRSQQDNDAGVAHFDGTIAPPPARTNP
jgi:hypothetical protein